MEYSSRLRVQGLSKFLNKEKLFLTLIMEMIALMLPEYFDGQSCILVLTTSAGWVKTEARDPPMMPHPKV